MFHVFIHFHPDENLVQFFLKIVFQFLKIIYVTTNKSISKIETLNV